MEPPRRADHARPARAALLRRPPRLAGAAPTDRPCRAAAAL